MFSNKTLAEIHPEVAKIEVTVSQNKSQDWNKKTSYTFHPLSVIRSVNCAYQFCEDGGYDQKIRYHIAEIVKQKQEASDTYIFCHGSEVVRKEHIRSCANSGTAKIRITYL